MVYNYFADSTTHVANTLALCFSIIVAVSCKTSPYSSLSVNTTSENNPKSPSALQPRNYQALLLLIIPLASLFGNTLVILSVFWYSTLRTATNFFIVSLACADILVSSIVMPFAVYTRVLNGRWDLGDIVCDFFIACDVCMSTSSIMNLVAISFDRYIAVTRPLEYMQTNHKKRILMTIILCWSVSILIASPILFGINQTKSNKSNSCDFNNPEFTFYSSLGSYWLPCVIIITLYSKILRILHVRKLTKKNRHKPKIPKNHASKHKKLEKTLTSNSSTYIGEKLFYYKLKINENNDSVPKDKNFILEESKNSTEITESQIMSSTKSMKPSIGKKSLSMVNLSEIGYDVKSEYSTPCSEIMKKRKLLKSIFLLCLTPFFTMNTMNALCIKLKPNNCVVSPLVFELANWIGYFNSLVNPIIYTVLNPDFRKAFTSILSKCCDSK